MEHFEEEYYALTLFDTKRGKDANWKQLIVGLNSAERSTRFRSLNILIRSAHAIATELTSARDVHELGKLLCLLATNDIDDEIRVIAILALSKCTALQTVDKYFLEKAREIGEMDIPIAG